MPVPARRESAREHSLLRLTLPNLSPKKLGRTKGTYLTIDYQLVTLMLPPLQSVVAKNLRKGRVGLEDDWKKKRGDGKGLKVDTRDREEGGWQKADAATGLKTLAGKGKPATVRPS
jgi:hypothetical protein